MIMRSEVRDGEEVSLVRGHARRDGWMQRTALRARKIGAILSVRISKNDISIYEDGAGDGQSVRRHPITAMFEPPGLCIAPLFGLHLA
jgi:hypothetical protein